MLWKSYIQYTSKFGKLSSGHRTGKGQFSFQSLRKAMPKNAETTTQLHSSQFNSIAQLCLFVTAWTAAHQASLSITNSWSPLKPMSFHLSLSYLFAFSCCSWGSQGKNTEVVFHFLLQWTTFCRTSPPWPSHLGWPHMAWLSFIELDKAVVHVISWLVVCDYGFSLSALWCPLSMPTILLGFLLPWT